MKRSRTLLAALLMVALLLPGLGLAEEMPVVGILQYVQHDALDSAREGFIKGLKDAGFEDQVNIIIDYQNGQASQDICASIADTFVADGVDLMLGIATPAVLSLAGKTETIPILGTAVTDYVGAKLAKSDEAPGFNISGTSDMNPVADQIKLIKRFLPEAKVVGILYTGSEVNSQSQVRLALEEIKAQGMEALEVTVNNSNDVQQAVQSLAGRCDVIYLPTDNIISAAIPIVAEEAMKAGLPLSCGEEAQVSGGGTFTLGVSYFRLGEQTGQMAAQILRGEAQVGEMPIQRQTDFQYLINKTACEALGIEIPEDLAEFAVEL
ncbi:MAG: ABC transporter substrate-binding protein [Clostridiales bacterium]|nr:ABC transporter substrate-binding protein [Clostridiales bacterium]